MLTQFPSNIKWHEPTSNDKNNYEADAKLVCVADMGVQYISEKGFYGEDYGHLDIVIDADFCVTFNYYGGGPAPYDEWEGFYMAEYSRTLEHAKQIAELVYGDIMNKVMTEARWDALGFRREQL